MIIYHGSTVLVEKPEIRISDSFEQEEKTGKIEFPDV